MEDNLILVDIGNTNIKAYKNGVVTKVNAGYLRFLPKFYYINVNKEHLIMLKNSNGVNLEPFFHIKTNYKGMGIDRIAVCSIISDGIVVDAGSAITIDKMKNEKHEGGIVSLGLGAIKKSFAGISDVLNEEFCSISLDRLPQNTQEAISFSVFKPLKLLIKEIKEDLPIYFTGGDGKLLSGLFEDSTYDELLVFKAMQNVLKLQNLEGNL